MLQPGCLSVQFQICSEVVALQAVIQGGFLTGNRRIGDTMLEGIAFLSLGATSCPPPFPLLWASPATFSYGKNPLPHPLRFSLSPHSFKENNQVTLPLFN